MNEIWSGTDFTYMCLKDSNRVKAFKKAIQEVVKKGDTVVDAGSGSGILAFFAVEAGAKEVYAVEIDAHLAESLRESVKANGFEGRVKVVQQDVMTAELPQDVDVVIAEILDTGLMDEHQVPALNELRKKGVITNKTKILPKAYTTFIDLIHTDHSYYGYKILAPKHEWPFYAHKGTGWEESEIKSVSEKKEIFSADFETGLVEEEVSREVEFELRGPATGIRISGDLRISERVNLGDTNAINGNKILSIEPIDEKKVKLKISYTMGGGLHTLKVERIE